jgi:MoaA/NifB/PqqE/SkfB family radical SAM enzyme
MTESVPHKRNKLFSYWIDIVGTCNLRCPTCPTGNYGWSGQGGERNPSGFMALDLFRDILRKIRADDVSDRIEIHLYNWGEPLMHPRVADFVAATKAAGFYCGLSSNFNLEKNLKDIVKAGPDFFRVSLSGFYQDVYARTHRLGDVRQVKANMYRLRHCMDAYDKSFFVQVLYHIYRHNAGEDLAMMVKLCDELGFNLDLVWAFFMPAEKAMACLDGHCSEEDRKTLEMLAIGLNEGVALSNPYKESDCTLRRTQTSINFDGTVQLCCATYERAHVVAPSFLDIGHDELQRRKYANPVCGPCMDSALHVLYTYGAGAELDRVGNEALTAAGSPYRVQQFSEPHLVLRQAGGDVPIALPRVERPKVDRGLRRVRRRIGEMARRYAAVFRQ